MTFFFFTAILTELEFGHSRPPQQPMTEEPGIAHIHDLTITPISRFLFKKQH